MASRFLLLGLVALVGCGGTVAPETSTGSTAPSVTPPAPSARPSPAPAPSPSTGPTTPPPSPLPPSILAKWIAFESDRDGASHIYVSRVDGTGLFALTSGQGEHDPAFSPDGKWLAYATNDGALQEIDLQTRVVQKLTVPLGASQPAWSPDGTKVACHLGNDLAIVAVDGSSVYTLAHGIDATTAYAHPTFAPNGHILVDRYNLVAEFDLSGNQIREVFQSTTTSVITPAVSPDGTFVVAAIQCSDAGHTLYLAPFSQTTDPCRGGMPISPQGDATRPAVGADGYIAYEVAGATSQIVVMQPGASVPTVVASGRGNAHAPAWSPVSF